MTVAAAERLDPGADLCDGTVVVVVVAEHDVERDGVLALRRGTRLGDLVRGMAQTEDPAEHGQLELGSFQWRQPFRS